MGRQKQQRQRQRQRERRRQQAPPPRRSSPIGPIVVGAGVVALAVVLLIIGVVRNSIGSTPTPTSILPTAPAGPAAVDGIQCGAMEQLAYHIHQHLDLYLNGKHVDVPSEIGIPGGEQNATCFYWIHVHQVTPNIIHVESPIHKTFTLGDFFDIWKATKDTTIPPGDSYVLKLQSAAAQGNVTAYYNSKKWTRGYRSIPLVEHASITVEIGKPVVAPKVFHNWQGL